MARILSFRPNCPELEKENPFKRIWEEFLSLDKFTKLFIITYLLIVIATPSIIMNRQIFNSRAESNSQRLESIAQLQDFQQRFRGASSSVSQTSNETIQIPKENKTFLEKISAFFMNGINYLMKLPSSLSGTK
jgi:hypothetical protein